MIMGEYKDMDRPKPECNTCIYASDDICYVLPNQINVDFRKVPCKYYIANHSSNHSFNDELRKYHKFRDDAMGAEEKSKSLWNKITSKRPKT